MTPAAAALQTEPASGDGYWYLARARNACADGSFDSGFSSQAVPRDAALAAATNACAPCDHAKCTIGAALDETCDLCVAAICEVDSFCCTNSWDDVCVEQVRTVCGSLTCPESQGTCDHTLCETGAALVSGCDGAQAGCVATVCAEDAYCCDTEWDDVCVDEVATLCQLNCQ